MKFRTRSNRRRLMRALVLGLATAAVVAPGASARLADYPDGRASSQPRQISDAVDRQSSTPPPDWVDRTVAANQAAEQRALVIRSQELNRINGVGSSSQPIGHRDYADGRIPNVAPSDSGTSFVSDDFEWGTLAIGVALGLMFSMFAAMTVGRRGRMAHS